jgi:3',5'-cyclic AMP phosphodiesterase CpdA
MRIVLITDTHVAPMPAAAAFNANLSAAGAYAARIGADLTVHLGDITVDGAHDAGQLDFARGLCADWPTPIRFLPGNHDIGDNPPGPGAPTKHPLNLERLAQYRNGFGPDFWAMNAAGWRVVGLNAQLFGTDTAAEAEQWEWLAAELALGNDRPIALLLHKPLFQTDHDDVAPHIRYVPLAPRRRLLDLLDRADVRIVLSGHTHQYLDRVIAGRRHVWVPSTGFYIPDGVQDRVGEKIVGLGVLELGPDLCRFELVCAEGVQRHCLLDHLIYPEVAEARARIGYGATAKISQRSV